MIAGKESTHNSEENGDQQAAPLDVGVIGGGWSGIAAAWNLRRAGASVTLYDDQATLGGRSHSVVLGSRALTIGGKNIGQKYENFRAFAASLGSTDYEFHGMNVSPVGGGETKAFDSTRRVSSFAKMFRAMTARDVVRLLRLMWLARRRRENCFCGGSDFVRIAKRAGDPPLSEYFSEACQQVAIRMTTIRQNGAEADEIYLECLGTQLGMALDNFDQLSNGFEDLFAAFAGSVAVRNETRVSGLTLDSGRVNGLVVQENGGRTYRAAHDAVVVAVPAHAAAKLLEPLSTGMATTLRAINYYPATVVLAEYDRPVFGEEMRARTFPSNSLLSNASPYGLNDRHIVRYTFSGRAYRNANPDQAKLPDLGEELLRKEIDLTGATRVRAMSECWEHAYCGYSRFHSKTIGLLDEGLQGIEGIALAGDYLRGASIEACFRAAFERTDSLMARMGIPARPGAGRRR